MKYEEHFHSLHLRKVKFSSFYQKCEYTRNVPYLKSTATCMICYETIIYSTQFVHPFVYTYCKCLDLYSITTNVDFCFNYYINIHFDITKASRLISAKRFAEIVEENNYKIDACNLILNAISIEEKTLP